MLETKALQLSKIHSLQIKIALEIKRICEKNGLPYFIIAGTLLGAVRHGGFIPWDDDMDFGLLREDYEKFIEACKTDLSDEFFLHTWDTDPEYPFSYAKIRLNGTYMAEEFSKGTSLKNNGIFVDLFPFDNVPDDEKKAKKQAKSYFFCKRFLWLKKGMGASIKNESFKQRLKYTFSKCVSAFIPYNWLKKHFKKIQIKYNNTKTRLIVTDGSYSYDKESIERKWATNLENVKFETEEFLSFKDRIDYLEHFYGDYMKLPDEDKRYGHKLIEIDFGPYSETLEVK